MSEHKSRSFVDRPWLVACFWFAFLSPYFLWIGFFGVISPEARQVDEEVFTYFPLARNEYPLGQIAFASGGNILMPLNL